jgi:hypothetical protein
MANVRSSSNIPNLPDAPDFPDLPEPAAIDSPEDADRELYIVMATVSKANEVLLGEPEEDAFVFDDKGGIFTSELFKSRRPKPDREKLEKWIRKLYEILKAIVAKLSNVLSFSVTVGTTISVTVNFGTH